MFVSFSSTGLGYRRVLCSGNRTTAIVYEIGLQVSSGPELADGLRLVCAIAIGLVATLGLRMEMEGFLADDCFIVYFSVV
jgi:hypothetical protein